MSNVKKYIEHWWIIIWLIFLVNGLFFFGVRHFAWLQADDQGIEKLRTENNYTEIIATTWQWTLRTAPAYVKLWDMWSARRWFLVEMIEATPTRRSIIRKAMLLLQKDDRTWAQEVLEEATHTDPLIRSLFLALRGYIYCVDKKRDACEILAEDSVTLDPLAPFWLLLQGVTHHARREFSKAKEFFTRAKKLGGYCLDTMCLYARGITDFYNADYTWAIEDLSSILDDELYGYDAKIFLWRTFFNKKMFTEAEQRFQQSRDHKWWIDWTSELWLARVALAQWDVNKAKIIYQNAYLSGDYGLELVTDYLFLAYFTYDNTLVAELTTQVERMVGQSPWNHLLVVRVLKDINNLELARTYLQKWRLTVETIEEIDEQEKYIDDFVREEHNILVKEFYQALLSWEDIQQQLETLDALAVDPLHTAFLRWLQSLVTWWVDTTMSWFQLIPQLTSTDMSSIRFWYVLFRGDTRRALQILSEINQVYGKSDEKLLWMKRAVTSRLGEEQLAARYLYQLKQTVAWEVLQADLSDQELRKEAFRTFTPWMHRMAPYFSLDFWWISVSSSSWAIAEF